MRYTCSLCSRELRQAPEGAPESNDFLRQTARSRPQLSLPSQLLGTIVTRLLLFSMARPSLLFDHRTSDLLHSYGTSQALLNISKLQDS